MRRVDDASRIKIQITKSNRQIVVNKQQGFGELMFGFVWVRLRKSGYLFAKRKKKTKDG